MIDGDDEVSDGTQFSRSYDYFKHMTGVALVSLGGVFAFVDGGGLQFDRRTLVVVLAFLGLSGITSFLMAGGLATLEVKPEPCPVVARRIRIGHMVVGFSLAGGLGGFIFNFTSAIFK